MTRIRLILALTCGLILTLALVAAITETDQAAQAQGAHDRYVLGTDGSDTGDCSDEQHPCRTIQYAIDQATDGDAIRVASHVLAGPQVYEEMLVITKSITLDGAWEAMCVDPSDLTCSFSAIPCDPANVTIDAQQNGRVISITGRIAPVIDCFTITGGDATGLGGSGAPGYDVGGGICSEHADTTIANCVIRDNVGSTSSIAWGGGLGFYRGNPTVRNCLVEENVASTINNGYGGGVYFRRDSARLEDSVVRDNSASTASHGRGGGVASHFCQVTMEGNAVQRNVANVDPTRYGYGGGIYLYGGSSSSLTNTIVTDNGLSVNGDGSGIYLESTEVQLLHTTLANNQGGGGQGVYAEGGATVEMTNTVVAGHALGAEASGAGTNIELAATLWWDTAMRALATDGGAVNPQAPNVEGSPDFVNAGYGDYHIGSGSAAVDAGVAAGVTRDADGDPRPIGSAPDLGADEYMPRVYLPLVLHE